MLAVVGGLTAAGWCLCSSGLLASAEDEDPEHASLLHRTRSSRLHRLDPVLQKFGRAKTDNRAASAHRRYPSLTHVVRVALTGGPCAGKSSCLVHITRKATEAGFDVYTAPEVATLFFNSGVQLGDILARDDKEGMFTFQSALLQHQLSLERALTKIAASTGRPSIIIFDRGCIDAKGYMSQEVWERVLGEANSTSTDDGTLKKGVTEEYLLKRYDGVLHLVTAADGAPQFYKHGKVKDDAGNDVIRHESPEQAVELDKKMREVWKAHPQHHIVANGAGGFQEKLSAASDVVLELARKTHPEEYETAQKKQR